MVRTARRAVLQIPHVGGVPLLIRFRGTHGDKHPVAVGGVRHVGPAQGGDFRPPQPAHEQQPGDHGVRAAAPSRRGVGFNAPAVSAGTFGGGKNRGEPVRAQRGGLAPAPVGGRATVAAQHARGRCPGGVRLAGELGPKPDGGDGEGGGCGRAARLERVGEVGGEQGVVNRGGPPPGVQARQRAEVGPSGVDADRGVGELPGGRRGDGQRPRRVGASGERGRVGRCCLKHNGHYQSL